MINVASSVAASLLLFAIADDAFAAASSNVIFNTRAEKSYLANELAIAVSETEEGDVLTLGPGTFTGNGAPIAPNHHIVIAGAGPDSTTIDVTGTDGYGIHLYAPGFVANGPSQECSKLFGFTLQGPAPNKYYGIHTSPGCNGIVIDNVVVKGTTKTGIDLNGAEDCSLSNIVSIDSTGGFGLSLVSSQRVTIENITTGGNAWGGIAIYPARQQYQTLDSGSGAPHDITFKGLISSDIGEGGRSACFTFNSGVRACVRGTGAERMHCFAKEPKRRGVRNCSDSTRLPLVLFSIITFFFWSPSA